MWANYRHLQFAVTIRNNAIREGAGALKGSLRRSGAL